MMRENLFCDSLYSSKCGTNDFFNIRIFSSSTQPILSTWISWFLYLGYIWNIDRLLQKISNENLYSSSIQPLSNSFHSEKKASMPSYVNVFSTRWWNDRFIWIRTMLFDFNMFSFYILYIYSPWITWKENISTSKFYSNTVIISSNFCNIISAQCIALSYRCIRIFGNDSWLSIHWKCRFWIMHHWIIIIRNA